jgi:hypothetical protein
VAQSIRTRLKSAAKQLKTDGHDELASAVDAVLAPGGWSLLRSGAGAPSASNLPITLDEDLREALKREAEAKDVTLSSLVNDGFRAVVAGTWVPPKPVRARRGAAYATRRVVLNVRADDVARADLRDMLPELSAALGFRVTEGHVALAWMREELGLDSDSEASAE